MPCHARQQERSTWQKRRACDRLGETGGWGGEEKGSLFSPSLCLSFYFPPLHVSKESKGRKEGEGMVQGQALGLSRLHHRVK